MKNTIILFCLIGLYLSSCKPATEANASSLMITTTNENMKPALIHTVYFWTKEGTTDEQMKDFEKGLIKLGTCPQIASYFWGPPAPTEARGVVDNTYTYAISSQFNSVADEKAYQSEPIHLAFIEAHQDIWEKVIVYDNVVK